MLNFLAGIVAAVVGVALYGWLKKKGLARTWYDWVLSAVVYAWTLFTIAFVCATLYEDEPRAAAMGGIIFGIVALVGVIVLRIMFTRRAKAKGAGATA